MPKKSLQSTPEPQNNSFPASLPSPIVEGMSLKPPKFNITVKKTRSTVEDIKEYLSDEIIDILERISYYTNTVGLSLKEACLLVEVDFEWFSQVVETNEVIKAVITKKELEWKKDLMLAVSNKAKSGDSSLAQWLLEKRFPDEFGKKKADGGNSGNVLVAAMEFIRRQGDSSPVVHEETGRAVFLSRNVDQETTMRLNDLLK